MSWENVAPSSRLTAQKAGALLCTIVEVREGHALAMFFFCFVCCLFVFSVFVFVFLLCLPFVCYCFFCFYEGFIKVL